jgi:hypothetical protein
MLPTLQLSPGRYTVDCWILAKPATNVRHTLSSSTLIIFFAAYLFGGKFLHLAWLISLINALSMDVNSLIHNQQQSTGALIATNLIQLIIRQGPNLYYVISCFLNTRLTISGLGTIPITGGHISRTTAPKFGISEALPSFGEVFISTCLNSTSFNQIIMFNSSSTPKNDSYYRYL